LKVLAVMTDAFGSNGGIAKFNRDFLTATCASPMVSGVVSVIRIGSDIPEDIPLKLDYITRGTGGKWNFIREVIRTAQSHYCFDLVLCGHINLLPIAYIVARVKKAPLWCVVHGVEAWQPHQSRLVNWIVRRLGGFISVSKYTENQFIAWSGLEAEKGYLLPNCFDSAAFTPGPKNYDLLERYGLHGKTILMTLGRLDSFERRKGFDEVIEVLPALAKKIPEIVYMVVGNGEDKQRLEEKVAALGMADRVIFTGYVEESEKTDHYRLADAYVMPSQGEGFGIVYLEAMACGVPVVGSKADGGREALRDGKLGILVDPDNPEEIIKAVLEALKRSRCVVPKGLEYFSYNNFECRCHEMFNQIWGDRF